MHELGDTADNLEQEVEQLRAMLQSATSSSAQQQPTTVFGIGDKDDPAPTPWGAWELSPHPSTPPGALPPFLPANAMLSREWGNVWNLRCPQPADEGGTLRTSQVSPTSGRHGACRGSWHNLGRSAGSRNTSNDKAVTGGEFIHRVSFC